jgi:hypothetical protein
LRNGDSAVQMDVGVLEMLGKLVHIYISPLVLDRHVKTKKGLGEEQDILGANKGIANAKVGQGVGQSETSFGLGILAVKRTGRAKTFALNDKFAKIWWHKSKIHGLGGWREVQVSQAGHVVQVVEERGF